jgi:hypothetical protein
MVLNDNNKAQRNMGVYPASGSGPMSFYALIHNAALIARDLELAYELDPVAARYVRELELAEIGGRATSSKLGGSLVLRGMEPGENRWIRISMPASASAKVPLPLYFRELHERTPVNGFGIAPQQLPLKEAAAANVEFHGEVLTRAGALLQVAGATAAGGHARRARIDARSYPVLLRRHLAVLGKVAEASLAGDRRDRLGIAASYALLERAVGRKVAELPNAHSNLLHALDAGMTMLQKSRGDTADIVQTIDWMVAVARQLKLRTAEQLAAPSRDFVRRYEKGTAGADAYPAYVRRLLPTLELIARSKPAVRGPLAEIRDNLGRPAELQQAHRSFVAALR